MTVTIFHNPACGTSRNVLAILRHAGIEPDVVEYLNTPPTKDQLRALIADMGITVRDLLREKGTPYSELKLGDPIWGDDELLDFIDRYPILMNRPIVVTPATWPPISPTVIASARRTRWHWNSGSSSARSERWVTSLFDWPWKPTGRPSRLC